MKRNGKSPKRKRRFSRESIERLVAEYRAGGLTQREFALAHGLGYSTFTRWLRVHGAKRPDGCKPQWLEIGTAVPAPQAQYVVETPGGFVLKMGSGFNPKEVQQLIHLAQASCSP